MKFTLYYSGNVLLVLYKHFCYPYIRFDDFIIVCFCDCFCSYKMMVQCWEAMPDERPSFKILYKNTSKYIEGIAGYLEIGFNPFAGHDLTGTGEVGSTVEIQDNMESSV